MNLTETVVDIIAQLERENAALRAMLGRVTHAYSCVSRVCPVCYALGHNDDCALAALLKGDADANA